MMITRLRASVTMIGALLLLGVGALAHADAIHFEITPVTPAALTQGEPIVLHYKIVNNSAQYVTVNLGQDGAVGGTLWVTQRLTSADGAAVPALKDPFSMDTGGLHFNDLRIEPHGRKEGDLVASRCFSIPDPGKYTLDVAIHLTYGVGDSDDASLGECINHPKQLNQDAAFPLTVTASDPKRLQALAVGWEADIEQGKGRYQLLPTVQKLAALPEAQAWPSWKKLSENAGLGSELALELARRPTVRTADIISQVIWPSTASDTQNVSYELGNQFYGMYNQSSGALKDHIRQIYAAHGVNVDAPGQVFILVNGG